SRFIEELPVEHVEIENTIGGTGGGWGNFGSGSGFSMNDAGEDPFAHVQNARPARSATRGPGWQRAVSGPSETQQRETQPRPAQPHQTRPRQIRQRSNRQASSPRSDIAVGTRVFHDKFGYGFVTGQDGNTLEIVFESGATKRVMDSYVSPVPSE
ncbi:MAG: hypothetical protein ACK5NN_02455, partial [Sphingomonadaceae bacterium]